jgi:hypothetical protein
LNAAIVIGGVQFNDSALAQFVMACFDPKSLSFLSSVMSEHLLLGFNCGNFLVST